MGIRPVVLLVVYWAQVEIRLQLPVGAFNLADEIVVVPCGFLVERPDVRPEEVRAEHLFIGQFDSPCYRCHFVLLVFYHFVAVVSGNGGILAFQLGYAFQDCLILLRTVLLPDRCRHRLHAFLEPFSEAAVHGLLLQGLRRRLDLQVIVPAFHLHLLQLYGTLLAVIDSNGLRARLHLVVRKCLAGDAEVVVAFLPDEVEVLLRGYASIHHHKHLLVLGCFCGILCYKLVHHVGKGFGVGGVALQYGEVADEAVGVDAKGEHQQLAVPPLLLAPAELGLTAAVLAPFEVEVGQVEKHDAVRGLEQVVRHMEEVFLYPLLLLQKPVGHAVHLAVLHVLQGQVHQIAHGRVPLHDAHRAKLRRRVYCAHYEMGNGQLHHLLAPAEGTQKTIETHLAEGLQTEPFRTDVTCLLVFQGFRVHHAPRLVLAGLNGIMDEVKLVLFLQHPPVLINLLTDNITVATEIVIPKLTMILVLVLIGQTTRNVANLQGTQTVDATNIQQDAGAWPAAGITIRLFQAVVLLVLACLGVVSYLRCEIHATKVHISHENAVFYMALLDNPNT